MLTMRNMKISYHQDQLLRYRYNWLQDEATAKNLPPCLFFLFEQARDQLQHKSRV